MCPRDPVCEEKEHVEEINNTVLPEEVLLKIFSFLPLRLESIDVGLQAVDSSGQGAKSLEMGHSYC